MAKTQVIREDGIQFKLGDIVSMNDLVREGEATQDWNRFQITAFNKSVTLVRVAGSNGVLEGEGFRKVYSYLHLITKVGA